MRDRTAIAGAQREKSEYQEKAASVAPAQNSRPAGDPLRHSGSLANHLLFAAGRAAFRPRVHHAPDRLRAVVGHHQRTVRSNRYSYWTAPHLAVFGNKTRYEVLVFALRPAILERYPDHLVSDPVRLVPGAVLRRENIAQIFLRELLALVEGHTQRCIMGLQQNIRHNNLARQLRMLARQ